MNIEDIQVGDFVYSYDTITGTLELREVTAVFSLVSDHINYITIVDEHGNEQVIETTDGHPFWVVTDEPDLERAAQGVIDENGAILHHNNIAPTENGFWVEAKDLREGDVFLGANGELSTVVSVERVEFPDGIAVYNLTVDGNHNYFVIAACDELGQTSILVHNAGYGNNSTVWGNVRSFVSAFGAELGAAYRASLDNIQTTMDLAGNAPVIGSVLNAANAAIYAARGNYYSAASSGVGAVPIVGQYLRHAPTVIKNVVPAIKFPGTTPSKAPLPGYEWRGRPGSSPGSAEGNWYNPATRESLRPDLNHPAPIGPHWDYRDPSGQWWRVFPDDSVIPK